MSKIYYLINENKEIIEDGFTKFNENCLEMNREDYHIKNGYNGACFFEDYMQTNEYKEKELAFQQKSKLKRLRRQREIECFTIINRGPLWYERLTTGEKEELRQWYQEWLDVTDTLKIPNPPSFL